MESMDLVESRFGILASIDGGIIVSSFNRTRTPIAMAIHSDVRLYVNYKLT